MKNQKKQIMLKKWPQKRVWHNTDPPQQAHWVRIILGKLDTIQYLHTIGVQHYWCSFTDSYKHTNNDE